MDFNSAALGIGDVARGFASSVPVESLKAGVVPGIRASLGQSFGNDAAPSMRFDI